MKLIKRNGAEEIFSKKKLAESIEKANQQVPLESRMSTDEVRQLTSSIEGKCKSSTATVNTGDIADMVEDGIANCGKFLVAKAYIIAHYERMVNRRSNTIDDRILSLLSNSNEVLQQENANKNPQIMSVARDYMAGEVSKDISMRYLIPSDIYKAHKDGIIHFHDLDYFAMLEHNCDLWNLEDMLQNGTVINKKFIKKPHTFLTACTITSQISAVISSSQYGGQTFTLTHLAPFVEETRKYFREHDRKEPEFAKLSDEEFEAYVDYNTRRNIRDGIQTLNYQLNTISGTNGQTPFVSICMYLGECDDPHTKDDLALVIEEVLRQRIQGMQNELGEPISQAFPKLLYILEEDNIHPESKYYYLTELAAECTMKRMVPDYISEKVMKEWKKDKKGNGYCFPTMGCRSILSVWTDPKTKKAKFYGRFNKGVVSLNLPYCALLSKKDPEKFWYILEQKLELCHRALRLRHEHLVGVKSDVAPILWQYGALARLKPGETIDKLLVGGYSTISLGYVGLWETVKYMTGENTWDERGHEFAVAVMKKLKESCETWDAVEHIGYSLYGTPEESLTQKFSEALTKTFGEIPEITDKNYVTNSYHVPVWFGLEDGMDAFRKIDIETEFQKYSVGGAISYIEAPINQNKEAVLSIIKYIYDNIVYCEINNMGSCHCSECGCDGEVELVEDEHGKLYWKCKNCGNTDLSKLTCVVRVCGYLSSGNAVNQGRLHDIKDRKPHI